MSGFNVKPLEDLSKDKNIATRFGKASVIVEFWSEYLKVTSLTRGFPKIGVDDRGFTIDNCDIEKIEDLIGYLDGLKSFLKNKKIYEGNIVKSDDKLYEKYLGGVKG